MTKYSEKTEVNNIATILQKYGWTIALIVTIVLFYKAIYLYACGDDWVDLWKAAYNKIVVAETGRSYFHWGERSYRPTRVLVEEILYGIFGFNTVLWHGTNLLLHAINVILAYCLVLRITRETLVAMIAALFFGTVHFNVDVVFPICTMYQLLLTLFGLSAIILFDKYMTNGSRRIYTLSFIAFALALGSKETAIFILPVLLVVYLKHTREWFGFKELFKSIPYALRGTVALLPFFALAGLFLCFLFWEMIVLHCGGELETKGLYASFIYYCSIFTLFHIPIYEAFLKTSFELCYSFSPCYLFNTTLTKAMGLGFMIFTVVSYYYSTGEYRRQLTYLISCFLILHTSTVVLYVTAKEWYFPAVFSMAIVALITVNVAFFIAKIIEERF